MIQNITQNIGLAFGMAASIPKIMQIGVKLVTLAKEGVEAAQALKDKGISGAEREKQAVEFVNAGYDTFDEIVGFSERVDACVKRNTPHLVAVTYDVLNTFFWSSEDDQA